MKLSIKLVRFIYLSEDLLHTRSARCNVHINYRIHESIDVLIIVTLILWIWRNSLFHDIIDLMFQRFLTNSSRRRNLFRRTSHLSFCFIDHSIQRYSTAHLKRARRSSLRRERFSESLRNEIEREREIMWRAYIEFNIWQN